MGRSSSSTAKDAQALFHSLRSAYAATPTNLKMIDLYVVFSVSTALIQVVYMALVGSFPFNSFLSGVLSCVGTAVLGVCLRIQVNKENKEFKDLPPERAFADFVLCNLVLHLAKTAYTQALYDSVTEQYEVLKSAVHERKGLDASTPTLSLSQPRHS